MVSSKVYRIKCNTNDVVNGNPDPTVCGGLSKDTSTAFIGCFAYNLGINNAFYVELIVVMLAIDIAHKKGVVLSLD